MNGAQRRREVGSENAGPYFVDYTGADWCGSGKAMNSAEVRKGDIGGRHSDC